MSDVVDEAVPQEDFNRSVPAKVESEGDMRVAVATDLAGLLPRSFVHNFTGTAAERWRMMSLGENASEPGGDLPSSIIIPIDHWYMHRIRLVDPQTGEETEPIRTVLFTGEGKIYHFVSDGVAKSLAKIISAFGVGPYHPPISVTVGQIKTRKGFKTTVLLPAD